MLNYLCQAVRQVATSFGFEEYSAPVLEPLELFTAKSGEEIVGQLFNFVDKGGRSVALRPEMTPSVARMIGSNYSALKKPLKWFNIAENFRYERPQKGRLRAFYQFNLDIFGEDSCYADAEIIALIVAIMRKLRLENFCVRLSDRELWAEFLRASEITEEKIMPVLSIIDKSERESPEKTRHELEKLSVEHLHEKILRLKQVYSVDVLGKFLSENRLFEAPRIKERVKKLQDLLDILSDFGIKDEVRIDFGIVRGLAYYTGFVFEVFDKVSESRALAGGGRYDALTEKLGYQKIPAVGAAIGDVTLTDLLRKNNLLPNCERALDCFVVFENSCREWAFKLIDLLRSNEICTDFLMHDSAFDKQFKAAVNSNARFAIFCGEQEKMSGCLKLKNLETRQESLIEQSKLVDFLRNSEVL